MESLIIYIVLVFSMLLLNILKNIFNLCPTFFFKYKISIILIIMMTMMIIIYQRV